MDYSYQNPVRAKKLIDKYNTLGLRLYWAYANQAMIWNMDWEKREYTKLGFMLRVKLFKQLREGSAAPRTFQIDLQQKLMQRPMCTYCGNSNLEELSMDHIFPISKGGEDTADNLIWACKSCNSSKNATDMLEWHYINKSFPGLFLYRNYMKLAVEYSVKQNLMDEQLADLDVDTMPFNPHFLPTIFPEACDIYTDFENISWYDVDISR